jgi:SAM-dependent methyltransferase
MAEEGGEAPYLYDGVYASFSDGLYTSIRREAFGEDLGQTSFVGPADLRKVQVWLDLGKESHLLDIGCGSGGPALYLARETGCRVTGIDIRESAIREAQKAAEELRLGDRVRFVRADARGELPMEEGTFSAMACIDTVQHLFDRRAAFREWFRLLMPRGRLLLTDPVTISGYLRREELMVRSAGLGEFVFAPSGLDELLLGDVGFEDVRTFDLTDPTAELISRAFAVRERRRAELDRAEGVERNLATQRFLAAQLVLLRERRLLRLAHLVTHP